MEASRATGHGAFNQVNFVNIFELMILRIKVTLASRRLWS